MELDVPPTTSITEDVRSTPIHARKRLVARAFGEFILIVAGVLTALAASSLYSTWTELRLEREYVSRLAADIRADTSNWHTIRVTVEPKTQALSRVQLWLQTPDMSEGALRSLAADIVEGARQAFVGSIYARQTTFTELISTGRLHLISDASLRADLANYYLEVEIGRDRLRSRTTSYSALAYELVPRQEEMTPRPDLTSQELRVMAARAQAILPGATVAEMNRAILMRDIAAYHTEMAVALLERLELQ
jgi:hypothetical protein